MNIKELHKQLISWGKFWAAKESLQGYASTSVTERCCQVLRTGIWASSDKHLFNHQADNLYVPDWIACIDHCLNELPPSHRRVINRRYIKQVKLNSTERIALWHAQAGILAIY
ncbi:MAG: hypothetical protein CML20_10200 [Rheinheimera sp.]|nr:hypothetical protein [Rheinheimera sp.]|tara:strand:- start:43815 stop:44153 length:339 start_codon:yes stop_codon:yes gene_type:complete